MRVPKGTVEIYENSDRGPEKRKHISIGRKSIFPSELKDELMLYAIAMEEHFLFGDIKRLVFQFCN